MNAIIRSIAAAVLTAAAAIAQGSTAVRVVLLQDQTGSTSWTRTPTLRYEDLRPLMALIEQRGGEIAIGLIRDQSNRGLVRLAITVAEPVDLQPPTTWPSNPFLANRARAVFAAEKGKRERQRSAWEAEHAPMVDSFRADVERLLAAPSNARRTDVHGALRRADAFLAENPQIWGRPVYSAAIVVTDGDDNAHGAPAQWRSGAQILAVNGNDSIGVLARVQPPPRRFESIQAAIRHFIAAYPQ